MLGRFWVSIQVIMPHEHIDWLYFMKLRVVFLVWLSISCILLFLGFGFSMAETVVAVRALLLRCITLFWHIIGGFGNFLGGH